MAGLDAVGSGGISQTAADARYLALAGGTLTGDVVSRNPLTAGTLTVTNNAVASSMIVTRFDWTNAMVVALGASLTGDIKVCTLPAKMLVLAPAYMVITGTAAGVATLTASLGIISASYVDYIQVSDCKVAANTIYGDSAYGVPGNNLDPGGGNVTNLPSVTATTDVFLHFISTVQNLSATTGSTGSIYLRTMKLP